MSVGTKGGATDGDALELGLVDADGLIEALGETLGLSDDDGEILADGETLGLIDAEGDWELDGDSLDDGEILGLSLGEGLIDAEGEIEALPSIAAGRTATVKAVQSSLAEIVNVPTSSDDTAFVVVHRPNVAPVGPPETSAVFLPAKG